MMTKPTQEIAPNAGQVQQLTPDLALVLAPNPSPMTYWGTNTYILGAQSVAIIDPGPDIAGHRDALLRAIDGRTVSHILLTHSHVDHSPLARPLSQVTGAKVYAFGDSFAGRSAVMTALAARGLAGGGEGIDHDFVPDIYIADGERIDGEGWSLTAIHTPGHIGNHLCYQWKDALFSGDHVMGWASSLVSPPDGDLTDFMASCTRLASLNAAVFYPGHGAPVDDPQTRLNWLINHRKSREAQILDGLQKRSQTVCQLTKAIYHDVPTALLPAAERNVFAHLVDLYGRGVVGADPALGISAGYQLRVGN